MKKYIFIWYKIFIVLLALVGVLIQIGIFEDELMIYNLNYYTLLSNILCIVYFIIDIIYILKVKDNKTFCPPLKSIMTMSITVTMLIVIFLLQGSFPTTGLIGLSFIILHYIVPIMVILDWLLFDKKGLYKVTYPFLNLIVPAVYYIYVIILVNTGYEFSTASKYPYPFLDKYKLGYSKVIISDIVIVILYIILGFIYYFIDHKLQKSYNK